MPLQQVLFAATSNSGKLAEFQEAARACARAIEVQPLGGFSHMPACVEDGATFEANATKKALHYGRLAPGMIFADDSGLEVEALGGAPGVISARFAGPGANDLRNNEKLLRSLADVPDERRQARFVCVIALARAGRVLATFRGEACGVIGHTPRGHNGFGYDPLFLFPELGRTFAELTRDEKLRYSHRGRAFRKMLEWFQSSRQAESPRSRL